MEALYTIKNILQKACWISFLVLATGTAAFCQAGNGGISGVVTDPSGGVVPEASVTIKSDATGVIQSKATTGAGVYLFTALTPAEYDVTVSRSGFDTAVHNHVIVTVDQVTTVNFMLQIGKTSQIVTVTGTSPLAETSNSTVGQLIGAATINRVPLLTRDVYQLVQLSAGVAPTNGIPNASDTTAVFNARPGADVAGYTINGATPGSVQFLVDGSPIGVAENNLGAEIPAMQIPLDDVEEYRVETQNTPATYQSGGAGVISLVSKSGTNHFHGDGFVYIRPDVLAGNDYFLKANQLSSGQPNQPLGFHRYQEGGSIGGPIQQGKLFFFGDYEATQQNLVQTGYYTVPTAAERTGDFSADAFTIYDPLVPDLPNGERQPFPGNKIQNLNSIAQNYGSHFPSPNTAGVGPYHLNNYFGSGLDLNNAQKFDVRIDGYRSAKQHIYGRFSFARLLLANADLYGSSNIYDPNYYHIVTNARNFLLADDYSLTQNTLLQVRYSFTRHYENQTGDPRQVGFDMTSLGFPASLAAQQVYKDIPMISFGNGTANLGSGPWVTFQYVSENPFDIIVAISTTKGKHALTAGVEVEKQFMNEGQPVAPSGWYQFDNTATSSTTFAGDGSDYASSLLGMGSCPGCEYDNFTKDVFGAEASPYYGAYIQDNWKVARNLTINLGLRWEIFGGRTERHNRLEYFDPTVQYNVNGVPLTGGEQFAGVDGHGRSPFTTNMKDFGPRASFAWQPAKRLVIRGGSGIYYGPSTQMVANSALNSDGFFAATFWNSTAYNADGNTVLVNSLSNPFPGGVLQPTGSSLGPATNLGNELSTELHSQRTPTTYNFNLGAENEFPHGLILAVAYVGSRGRFLPLAGVDLNQLPLSVIGQYQSSLNDPVPNQWENVYPAGTPFYGQSTVPRYLSLETYPQFTCGGINCGVEVYGYPGGNSAYDSLQVKLEKRLTSHFTTLASFTKGKLMTDDFGPPLSFVGYQGGTAQDWKDRNLEHSLSAQDISYQLTWQASYDLPFGNGRWMDLTGWKNQTFGGWTLNTIVYFSSGVPIGAPAGTGDPYFSQRVDQICNPGKGAPHTAAQWFSYTCFAEPSSKFVAGTSSRFLSSVRTNGAHDLDASIFKNFPFGGERVLRLEVSSYNVTNSAQFGYPNVFWNPSPTSANMSGFGQITSAVNTPRQFQFASRFIF
jgi:hypothetical protein